MAKKKKTLNQLIDDLQPELAEAFIMSVRAIQNTVKKDLLLKALNARDTEAVLRVLDIDPTFFAPFDRAFRAAYEAGGDFAMAEYMAVASKQGVSVSARFNANAEAAREYVSQFSATKVVGISNELKATVREYLVDAFMSEKAPRSVALDLVGRINRATGKREGGIIGLTRSEQKNLERAASELASGDPVQLRNYMKRKMRNKQYDKLVKNAIKTGKPIPVNQANAMMEKMKNTALRIRGERIARTELLGGMNNAADQAMEQLIASGKVLREAVTNIWDASEDAFTRDSHMSMEGDRRSQGEAFQTGNGYSVRYPGDRGLGAPASEIINCRCRIIRDVDFTMGVTLDDL